ncbi:beta-propeller domain-containing protein [Candidatus Bathyarchaeota archaeon]|nr:beta-propeller domain-containing protein [Candidatus Bathyarchaeota archaeon]MBS7630842.1 beta-propeller domain-containing protein [Candidatus Bathyarchaeota archaeon]
MSLPVLNIEFSASPSSSSKILNRFSSEHELKAFVNNASREVMPYYKFRGWSNSFGVTAEHSIDTLKSIDFSGTNIQVEGVDEADKVKTDGRHIYLAVRDSIVIVEAYPPEEAKISSIIPLNESTGNIFINGDKLIVIVFHEEVIPFPIGIKSMPRIFYEPSTTVEIFDISNRNSPRLERRIDFDGFYVESRMIGDYVYLISNMPVFSNSTYVTLPKIKTDDLTVEIPASTIHYVNSTDNAYNYINVFALNVKDSKKPISHETILTGSANDIYVSMNSIYITVPKAERGLSHREETLIFKLEIDDDKIEPAAEGVVPGWVLNQFSMDEHEDYFRIATTTSNQWPRTGLKNNVYALDSSLEVVGKLEGLAPGEEIYSARFMGSRCYLVTFKKVDPLFVIDVSDPSNPSVLGKLKIPGYSDYLHPYDETHLIGLGKETVEAEDGDFAWYQGVKISLFDVSDVSKPREIAKYEIGDRGTDSPALTDHKAFLFSKSKNLLVIPVLEAKIDPDIYPEGVPPNAYGEFIFQGAYVFSISPSKGIELRGKITHDEELDYISRSFLYFDSPYFVKRSLYIEDTLYTISDKIIKMNDLNTLQEINEVELSKHT